MNILMHYMKVPFLSSFAILFAVDDLCVIGLMIWGIFVFSVLKKQSERKKFEIRNALKRIDSFVSLVIRPTTKALNKLLSHAECLCVFFANRVNTTKRPKKGVQYISISFSVGKENLF